MIALLPATDLSIEIMTIAVAQASQASSQSSTPGGPGGLNGQEPKDVVAHIEPLVLSGQEEALNKLPGRLLHQKSHTTSMHRMHKHLEQQLSVQTLQQCAK